MIDIAEVSNGGKKNLKRKRAKAMDEENNRRNFMTRVAQVMDGAKNNC